MSEENVEMLRAAYEGWNAGKGFDPELLTPDVEFIQPEIGDADYHGREGVARGIDELTTVFDEVRAEPEDFFVAGPHVVVFVRLSGVAKGSGASFFVGDAEGTLARWTLVLAWLEGLVRVGARSEQIVASACATFLAFAQWLERPR